MAIETLRNNSTLEVVGSSGVKVTTETIDSGSTNQRKRFNISGKVKLNKPTVVATLKLTAQAARRFLKAPGINKISNTHIELNSNLRMNLVSVEKNENNNITSYLYNLIYTSKESIDSSNPLNYELDNKTKGQRVKVTTGINRVYIGGRIVKKDGEVRKITITGVPDSTFKVSMVKIQKIRSSVDDENDRRRYDGRILNTYHENILSSKVANSEEDGSPIIDGKLNANGEFSFYQRFPKLTDANINTDGFGDYVFSIKPTNLINDLSKAGFKKIGNWYIFTLNQIFIPKITLRTTTNNVLYTINGQTIPGGASDQTVDIIFKGRKNSKMKNVVYTCKAISSSHSFSLTGKTNSFSRSGTSDWNDVTPSTNGGALVDIKNIKQTISTSTNGWNNDTFTMSFDFNIKRKPKFSDLIITMPLNAVVNCS